MPVNQQARGKGLRAVLAIAATTCCLWRPTAVSAADGYWLDQYNALLFMGLSRLDAEFSAMRKDGAAVVMVQADSLPDPLLRWIAWRARRSGLSPVAWIQRPTKGNLKRASTIAGYSALQVDDHFFTSPPENLGSLRHQLGHRKLWCSFQPGQYTWWAARQCDHVDIQLYRNACRSTVNAAYRLGVAGRSDTAIAVYHDGSNADVSRLNCFQKAFRNIGNRVFVFKWKNPEHWLSPFTKGIWQLLSRKSSETPILSS